MKNKFVVLFVLLQLNAVISKAQLYVQPGAVVGTTGKAIVTLENTDLQNNGTISQAATGKFVFSGTVNNIISGSNSVAFDTLEIAKTGAGKLLLANNITIKSAVQFTSGLIDLGNRQMLLQPIAVLKNETEASRITGIGGGTVVIVASAVNNPVSYNLGNLGASITTTQNLGTLQLGRSHNPVLNANNAALTGIQRRYIIIPENNAGLNATLRFYYLDAELNGKNENTLTLWKSEDGIIWNRVGADTRNTTSNYVQKNAIASFSTWTLTDASNPLPITIVSYGATCHNSTVTIQWKTGLEEHGGKFEVEKSIDGGASFINIATILAIGNGANTYRYTDAGSSAGTVVYRIKLISISNSFSYSPVFSGNCSDITMPFNIFPNPATSTTFVRLAVREKTSGMISIINAAGQIVYRVNCDLSIGMNIIPLNIAKLSAANYFVQMELKNGTVLKGNFVKQ